MLLLILAACKLLLPLRSAAIMTVLTAMGGAIGLGGGLIIQAPFLPDTLESTTQVLLFLGTGCLTGILLASVTAWTAWRMLSR